MSQALQSPSIAPIDSPGAVYGPPRVLLRLEGAAALALSVSVYSRGGHSWMWFAILFLAPDLSMIGYLAGPRVGAFCYNLVHNYAVPAAVGAALWTMGRSLAVPTIWVAHIGFDRMLGYGLKYRDGFGFTHLGQLKKRN